MSGTLVNGSVVKSQPTTRTSLGSPDLQWLKSSHELSKLFLRLNTGKHEIWCSVIRARAEEQVSSAKQKTRLCFRGGWVLMGMESSSVSGTIVAESMPGQEAGFLSTAHDESLNGATRSDKRRGYKISLRMRVA
eukprot:1692850-Pleurochrysis_carterae.AAC.5